MHPLTHSFSANPHHHLSFYPPPPHHHHLPPAPPYLLNAIPRPQRPLPLDTDRTEHLKRLRYFLATAPYKWSAANAVSSEPALNKFLLPTGEYVSCIFWQGIFYITGTDIVRALFFRFEAFGRPVRNIKKFEEGVFSDLRNLKPGQDACLEEPKSPFLDLLFKNQCIRTQKKQKVFYWFSVPHDRIFLDALERDLKREKMGLESTTEVIGEPAASFVYDQKRPLYEQFSPKHGLVPAPGASSIEQVLRHSQTAEASSAVSPSASLPELATPAMSNTDLGAEPLALPTGVPAMPHPEPVLPSNAFTLSQGTANYKQRRKKASKGEREDLKLSKSRRPMIVPSSDSVSIQLLQTQQQPSIACQVASCNERFHSEAELHAHTMSHSSPQQDGLVHPKQEDVTPDFDIDDANEYISFRPHTPQFAHVVTDPWGGVEGAPPDHMQSHWDSPQTQLSSTASLSTGPLNTPATSDGFAPSVYQDYESPPPSATSLYMPEHPSSAPVHQLSFDDHALYYQAYSAPAYGRPRSASPNALDFRPPSEHVLRRRPSTANAAVLPSASTAASRRHHPYARCNSGHMARHQVPHYQPHYQSQSFDGSASDSGGSSPEQQFAYRLDEESSPSSGSSHSRTEDMELGRPLSFETLVGGDNNGNGAAAHNGLGLVYASDEHENMELEAQPSSYPPQQFSSSQEFWDSQQPQEFYGHPASAA